MNNTDKKSVFTTCKIIIIFTLLLVFVAIVILISIYYDNTPYPNDVGRCYLVMKENFNFNFF